MTSIQGQKTIDIFCDGGLGNRLCVLVGGLITAQILNRQATLHWPENNWSGCAFNDLFIEQYPVTDWGLNRLFEERKDSIFLIHENQTPTRPERVLYQSSESLKMLAKEKDNVVYYHNQIPKYFSKKKVIKTLATLKIRPDLLQKMQDFIQQNGINRKTHGVHIRKTDMPVSSLEESKMETHVASKKKRKFFICSDDKSVEEKFSTFVNVFLFSKSSYVKKLQEGDWNDEITDSEGRKFTFNVSRCKTSVIEAFIDLLILSRTKILTKSHSSFLLFARLYSKINLHKND